MTDRDIITAAFAQIADNCMDDDIADIAHEMERITLGYHDALEEIKRKVLAPVKDTHFAACEIPRQQHRRRG